MIDDIIFHGFHPSIYIILWLLSIYPFGLLILYVFPDITHPHNSIAVFAIGIAGYIHVVLSLAILIGIYYLIYNSVKSIYELICDAYEHAENEIKKKRY
jgi:hypothetical protein